MKEEYRSGGTRDRGRRQERDRFDRRSRSGSRSPMRSKVSVVAPLIRSRDKDRRERSRSRSRDDRKDKGRNHVDDRGRLRMDNESRSFRNEHDYRDKEVREDRNISLKRGANSNSVFADLDRAVKKAREERNTIGYWNKKVIEVEEKDPNRWGHSGFKEMYSRDIDVQRSGKNFRRSRSGSRDRTDSKMAKLHSDRRQVGRKSRSRSRSPMLKQLHKIRERQEATGKIKPLLPKGFLSSRSSVKASGSRHGHKVNSSAKIRPLLSLKTETPPRRLNTFRTRKSTPDRGHKGHSSNYASRNSTGSQGKVKNAGEKPRQRLGPPIKRNAHDRRARSPLRRSSSFSGSESGHSRTPSPQLKRPYKSDIKSRTSNRSVSKSGSRSRSRSRQKSRSRRSRSRSRSSSSNSSEDEDVLELHPRRRRSRSYSISRSDSSSSDKSDSSASGARRSIPKRRRDSRSSSSNSSSGSDTDHSLAMAKDKDRSARNNIPSPIPHTKTVAKSVHGANGQPARVGNKMLTPANKAPAQAAVRGKAVAVVSKPQISGSKPPQSSPTKKIVTPAQKKEIVAVAQAGKKIIPVKKPAVLAGKQSDTLGKQGAPAGKQSTVAGAKQPSQAVKKPSQAVQPTKQAALASKQPVQSGKQPSKTPPSASKQKMTASSSATKTSQADKNRKQIQGPSDIDSDSSGDDAAASNVKKVSDKDKDATSKKNGRSSPARPKEEGEGESGSLGSSSDSASDSSSDSESEPRMTLSERFAKLTQMNTDKREFAKPVLSANEIDTKLKVVKDLRGPAPDTKVYVDGQQPARPSSGSWSSKSRPKSPEYGDGNATTRYPSAERQRHFERMSRDEPSERPTDWSDMTVRYNYYRDRGCFDERPLTLEEYSKWEAWYYEYKHWLENEERINQQLLQEQQSLQIQEPEFSIGSRLGRRGILGDQPERTVRASMSSRLEQRIVRSAPDTRPYFDRDSGRGNIHVNDRFARRIGHAPSGGLVVNIRQENNFGGRQNMQRGRRVGLQRN